VWTRCGDSSWPWILWACSIRRRSSVLRRARVYETSISPRHRASRHGFRPSFYAGVISKCRRSKSKTLVYYHLTLPHHMDILLLQRGATGHTPNTGITYAPSKARPTLSSRSLKLGRQIDWIEFAFLIDIGTWTSRSTSHRADRVPRDTTKQVLLSCITCGRTRPSLWRDWLYRTVH
jgi:hypothetical protein